MKSFFKLYLESDYSLKVSKSQSYKDSKNFNDSETQKLIDLLSRCLGVLVTQ